VVDLYDRNREFHQAVACLTLAYRGFRSGNKFDRWGTWGLVDFAAYGAQWLRLLLLHVPSSGFRLAIDLNQPVDGSPKWCTAKEVWVAAACRHAVELLMDVLDELPSGPERNDVAGFLTAAAFLEQQARMAVDWGTEDAYARLAEALEPNPRRLAAGKRNRALRKGLTEEGRERLRESAHKHKPWRYSTGPRTPEGKKAAIRNGKMRQLGPKSVREVRQEVSDLETFLKEIREARERAKPRQRQRQQQRQRL
jgi:hypothetical protein